jgi:hypothetical protein
VWRPGAEFHRRARRPSHGEIGVDAVFQSGQSEVLQPSGLGLDCRFEADVGQRLAAPEPERLTELVRAGAGIATLERGACLVS